MKRILHILPSNRFSGAENVVCQIINMFREKEQQYEMIYASPDGPIRDALQERNVDFMPLESMRIKSVRRAIKQTKPDIIHVHDMKASFFVSLACGRIPIISHIHNNNFDVQKPTLKAILYCVASIKAKRIVWVSESALNGYCFNRICRHKSTVLYNVVDAKELERKAAKSECKSVYDIVYIGRLTYQKNPQRLINILSKVIAEEPQIKVAIIGSGELQGDTCAAIVAKGMENNISYLGYMSNPYGILKNAKMMIMTSRWEGTPMCALEALALGVPIVSTPTDGLCEIIVPEVTGYLNADDDGIVRACIRLANDPVLQRKMSNESLLRANDILDIDLYRNVLRSIYES